jgi:hypothetical protein
MKGWGHGGMGGLRNEGMGAWGRSPHMRLIELS